jgi:hypothetical protein
VIVSFPSSCQEARAGANNGAYKKAKKHIQFQALHTVCNVVICSNKDPGEPMVETTALAPASDT